jgi:hypothetical protein
MDLTTGESGFNSRQWQRDFSSPQSPDQLRAHLSFSRCEMRALSSGIKLPGEQLTTNLLLMPRLRARGPLPTLLHTSWGFPQSMERNDRIMPLLGHSHLLPNTSKFIIRQSPCNWGKWRFSSAFLNLGTRWR